VHEHRRRPEVRDPLDHEHRRELLPSLHQPYRPRRGEPSPALHPMPQRLGKRLALNGRRWPQAPRLHPHDGPSHVHHRLHEPPHPSPATAPPRPSLVILLQLLPARPLPIRRHPRAHSAEKLGHAAPSPRLGEVIDLPPWPRPGAEHVLNLPRIRPRPDRRRRWRRHTSAQRPLHRRGPPVTQPHPHGDVPHRPAIVRVQLHEPLPRRMDGDEVHEIPALLAFVTPPPPPIPRQPDRPAPVTPRRMPRPRPTRPTRPRPAPHRLQTREHRRNAGHRPRTGLSHPQRAAQVTSLAAARSATVEIKSEASPTDTSARENRLRPHFASASR